MPNVRLDGQFTLRSPLSHIGESISATSYLVEETVLPLDGGEPEKVFAYSGNAWRGQLRDLLAAYMLDALGRPLVSLDMFHLLFSGGRIGGAQNTDLEQARRIRASMPIVALLGGGIGNQILEGKLRVGTCYPLCREAMPVLPRHLREQASRTTYADMTMLKEYSRRDDAKIASVAAYLPPPAATLLDGPAPKKKRTEDDVPTQMRIGTELVVPGVKLHTWITGLDLSDIELGCLVSGMHRFSRSPHIGGQGSRGHGLVDLDYTIRDLDTGDTQPFLTVSDGECLLAPPAAAAKDAYDQNLRSMYDAMLANKAPEITALLGAA